MGQPFFVKWTFFPLFNEKNVITAYSSHIKEITQTKQLQDKLKENEERYKLLFNNSQTAISYFNKEFKIELVNIMAAQYYKAEPKELIGKSLFDILPPEDAKVRLNIIKKVFETGTSFQGEQLFHFNNEDKWFYFMILPTNNLRGEINGVQVISIDITDHKKIEKALAKSEKKYKTYTENAPDGIFVINKAGMYVDVNPVACQMTGYSREELLKITIMELAGSNLPPKTSKIFNKLKENGTTQDEIILRKKNGESIHVSLKAVALSNDHFMAFCSDITNHKMAKKSLLQSKDNLAQAQKIAHLGSWEWDLINDKRMWSDELYRILGHKPQSITPSNEAIMKRIHPDDREYVEKIITKLVNGNKSNDTIKHRLCLPDETERFVEGNLWVKRSKTGKPISASGTLHDITERKKSRRKTKRK